MCCCCCVKSGSKIGWCEETLISLVENGIGGLWSFIYLWRSAIFLSSAQMLVQLGNLDFGKVGDLKRNPKLNPFHKPSLNFLLTFNLA